MASGRLRGVVFQKSRSEETDGINEGGLVDELGGLG